MVKSLTYKTEMLRDGKIKLTTMDAIRTEALSNSIATSTAELAERAQCGDKEAFHHIFERYARPIIGFIYDMVGQRDLAEDLTQETFVRAYKNLDNGLHSNIKLSTWLFGIAKNVARESLRTVRTKRNVTIDDQAVAKVEDSQPTPDSALLNKERDRIIKEALAALDEDKRLVFTLQVLQHRSYEEIVQITGFSLGKVKTDLHRARLEVRERMRTYMEPRHEL